MFLKLNMGVLRVYVVTWMLYFPLGAVNGSTTPVSPVNPYNCSYRCLPAPTQPTTRPTTPSDGSGTTRPMCDSEANGTQPCPNETGENETGQSPSCDRTTGQCLYGCVEKYLAGPYCNLSCENDLNCDQCAYDEVSNTARCGVCKTNFFKQAGECKACSKNCRLDNNTILQRCDMEDGRCPHGCTDGNYGLMCSGSCRGLCRPNVCDQFIGCCITTATCIRMYLCGCICSTFCSSRCLGGTCNRDCTCEKGCKPNGYYGPNCDRPCPDTCLTFPENATQTCNDTNGHCLHGCVSPSMWGLMCDKNCSENCLYDTCDQNTGACTNGCVTQLYGTNCSERCSNKCVEGVCDQITGTCLHGCLHGYHGNHCDQKCRQNCRENVCDMYNGTCTLGCVNGFFSNTCDRTCYINCAKNTCELSVGKCSLGCKNCFSGDFCEIACPVTFTFGYWIAGVGATIVVFVVVLIVITNRPKSTSLMNETAEYVNSPGSYEHTLHQNYETLHVQEEENPNYEMLDMSK